MEQMPNMPPMGPGSGGFPSPMPPMGPASGAFQPAAPPMGPGSGAFQPAAPPVAYAIVAPKKKWHALRTIAGIFKVFAWITIGFGVIAVIIALLLGSQLGNLGVIAGLGFGVAIAIGVGSAFLGMYGYAELILVLVSIEENTRKF